jgi:hypothetical protein
VIPVDVATVEKVEVCAKGYAQTHRAVSPAIKRKVYLQYGVIAKFREGLVIDHRIPLALGGSNAVENLAPMPFEEARKKDMQEVKARRALCKAGSTVTLRELQERFRLIPTVFRPVSEYVGMEWDYRTLGPLLRSE